MTTVATRTTRVLVHGASGKMGREVVNAIGRTTDLRVVGAVHRNTGGSTELELPSGAGRVPLSNQVGDVLGATKPGVMVDFSTSEAALAAAKAALARGVHVVTGTTGLTEANLKELDATAQERGLGVIVAPNFALGAVLLIHLAKVVGKYFDYVDVIEAHHEAKIDSPSGTALAIARALAEAHGKPFTHPTPEKEPLKGTRGGEAQGVGVHSIRMPGRMAHHEVLLGTAGQTMSLRHDALNRECYMPGVILAVREVSRRKGLTLGLDKLLEL
ncbi:MAG: 4-hydroxy-tetrahydrodipicolinate reductase [SAR202 cluster bacterium]|nr:4-hydroxy-tetrahydrodipicolinate reductase [SAR202 cluster bacterium]